MQREPQRQRGGAAALTFETKLENEVELLDTLLSLLARSQLPPEAWTKFHLAAVRDDRLAEVALAYENTSQGKRLKTMPPAAVAEFLFRASTFFSDAFGDELGAVSYLERALAAMPTHPQVFEKLEQLLVKSQSHKKLAEVLVANAPHRPRSEQASLLRRAADLFEQDGTSEEKVLDLCQQVLRLEPQDEATRDRLEARYLRANRHRDVTRLLEQALAADPPPSEEYATKARARLVDLYAGHLREPERSMPHVEALLARDPSHDEARRVATKLLEVKGLAARAAAALAAATEVTGVPGDVARFLAIELEHTRGPKRRDVLRKIGLLRQDRLGDDVGAYESFEAALALDPADDDMRGRYAALARKLSKETDAARTLSRVGAAVKDLQLRAKLTAEVGQLYLSGGDPRRAKTTLVGVMAIPDLDPAVALSTARALSGIYAAEKDYPALADALELVAVTEPDRELRQIANEELAELAMSTLKDDVRAIGAYRRLLDTSARARALAALEPLYEAAGDTAALATVLEERARDAGDPAEARRIALRAAELLTTTSQDAARAADAWRSIIAKYGPARDVHARFIPLLEAQRQWPELASTLDAETKLAPEAERTAILVRLGAVRLQKTREIGLAIDAFRAALEADASEKTSRVALEKLLLSGDHRLAAAAVLEPLYRAERSATGLLKVLDLKAQLETGAEARLAALDEAARVAEEGGSAEKARGFDFVARGLAEAVASGSDPQGWLTRLEHVMPKGGDTKRRAAALTGAFGTRVVDSPVLLDLARRTGEALAESGEVVQALEVYRRALAFEPASSDLLTRVDDLLRDQGDPLERIALYRAALDRGPPKPRRRELLLKIGGIQKSDVGDAEAAIVTYRAALADDQDDRDARAGLVELYTSKADWNAVSELLEDFLARATGDDARRTSLQLADVASARGDKARAAEHLSRVLAGGNLDAEDLVAIERVAEAIDDVDIQRETLRLRAANAEDPREQVVFLDRLARVEIAKGDVEAAVLVWKRAAQIAVKAGDDEQARRLYEHVRDTSPHDSEAALHLADLLERSEQWSALPDLYAVLLEGTELPSARVAILMRHARLLAEHLDDPQSALVSAAQAFELATGNERRDVLTTFTHLALLGKGTHIFAQAMDDAIAKLKGDDGESSAQRADFAMAKGRVLASNREGRDAAATAYRTVLDDARVDEARVKAALLAFESLLSSDTSEARRADRRWLLSWKADHAPTEGQVPALVAWAAAEETTFGDLQLALELYQRVLALDPENAEVMGAVSRLSLATNDVVGAIRVLRQRRDRSEGTAKSALDLEIATVLVERTDQPEEALASVAAVLLASPQDDAALALAARLLALPATHAQVVAILEKAEGAAEDAELRSRILRHLLDTPAEPPDARELRHRWFERLLDLHHAEGHLDLALHTALAAAAELPTIDSLWDRAESLARELGRPNQVADLYQQVLTQSLPRENALALGQRAVTFHEEWFEEPGAVVRILERVLEIDSTSLWAFDRLKLIFDASERWSDLFALFDHALLTAEGDRRRALLEDAAQIAKDFANNSDRAIAYLEQLLVLKPGDVRLVASLERLYERHGSHRELIALLTAQLPSLAPGAAQRARARVALLWLDEIGDSASALAVVEEIVALPDPAGVDVFELLEKVLAAAPAHAEARDSAAPPSDARGHGKKGDSATPKGKRVSVRQRAAALLKELYTAAGRDAELVRILEIELEAVKNGKERIRRHKQIAQLYGKLENDAGATEHFASLVLLEPDVDAHRVRLAELTGKIGRNDRLAEVLASAADECESDELRVQLLMHAADVQATSLRDSGRAIDLLLRVLALAGHAQAKAGGPPTRQRIAPASALTAARKAEPLLETAGRSWERLDVLEQIADLEADVGARSSVRTTAALLATELGENTRAIAAWEARLDDGDSPEALDGLVVLLERERRWPRLLQVLDKRASSERSPAEGRSDRVHIARIHATELSQISEAIDAWRVVERDFGENDETMDALLALFDTAARWQELADLLVRGAARAPTPGRRAELLQRLGDLQRERLDQKGAAIASYEGAVTADPHNAGARAGLRTLLNEEAWRAAAVESLLKALAATDEWPLALELTEHRLASASDARARARVLREVAHVAEERGKDVALAFHAIRRAFLDLPEDGTLETELARLAEATGEWRAYSDVYAQVVERSETDANCDASWTARLRLTLGETLEKRLDDAPRALQAYVRAAKEAPSEMAIAQAVIRAAGTTQEWPAAALVAVNFARVLGRATEDLFVAVEGAAQGLAAWDGITRALASAVKEASDLPPSVARDIEARLGAWHRDRRGDPEAAEEAFSRALVHDNLNAELLGSLAQIQRRAKGRPLVDSLLRLSQATGGDLDLLREAAEIAIGSVADRALAKSILESLLRLARERWVGEGAIAQPSVGGPQPPAPLIRWAVGELTRIHDDEGDAECTVELLEATSRLPFERAVSRGMLHDAARLSRTKLGDVDRAIILYSALYEDDPHDADAVGALLELYEAESRRAELLALRRRQIANARTTEERLALRLAAARLQVIVGDVDGCVQSLEANLAEVRRHADTCAELFSVLEGHARFGELATLLAQQAALAEEDGETVAAANLWERAAIINEERLGETVSAIAHHKRVIALDVRTQSLDSLARLSLARGDPTSAAQYLERLVGRAEATTKVALTLRLADALTASGRSPDARARLEASLTESPDAEPIRLRLAQTYRETGLWEPLAALLAQGGEHAPDKATHLRRLLDAAELYSVHCAKPELAVPLLERASDLQPEDRAIRLALADALGAAGRFADARTLLRALIDSFAGRRPKERAPAHYHLARLELTMGDRARALVELDAATRIDPSNPLILRALGELARDDGQFDRAERSYRALLVALKRPEEAEEGAIMVRSEVLLELGNIAERQGEHDRASEILESALETAAKSDVEGQRLENALRMRGDYPTLVRALEARLARAGDTPRAAPLLSDLADVLDVQLGHLADAFVARLRAVALLPTSREAHESALALARRTHGVPRYVDEVDKLVVSAQNAGDVGRACELLLRLGKVAEDELKDDKRAAELFERARSLTLESAHELDVLRSLDRVYERLGDREAQGRVLAQRVDAESKSTDKDAAADALYRFAALRLEERATVGEGCERLLAALALQKDEPRAIAILKAAAALHPSSERVLSLYEDVARSPGHERALVDALIRRATLPGAPSEPLREAVLVAIKLGDGVLAEDLLRRYIGHAREHEDGAGTGWALAALAELREAAGDLEEALRLKREAANASEPDEARRLSFEIARIAEGALGDLDLAAKTYEEVLVREPADREAWEPLLGVYRRMQRTSSLVQLLAKVVDYVDDSAERSRLRLERARLLIASDGFGEGADAMLREIVDDDPSQVEAALLLAEILEKSGREEELSELLARQIDAAKDRSDSASVGSLSLRLSALLEKKSAVDAKVALYAALEWVPEGRDILRELARLHEVAEEPSDRADVLERMLAVLTGSEAEVVALDLKTLRLALGDTEGANRALELGFRAFPAPSIGAELERVYRESGAWEKVAELFAVEARSLTDSGKRVARLREAATIYQKQLDEPAKAAALLRLARATAPDDQELLLELVDRLEAANDFAGAAAELSATIDRPVPTPHDVDDTMPPVDAALAPLYTRRAALRIELGETDAATLDLEHAFKLGGAESARGLATQFERLRRMAEARGDAAGDRALRLRLAEVLSLAGEPEQARALLGDLVKQNTKDRDALRLLARLDEEAGHWDAVTATYRRLVTLEEGGAMVDAALRLADACERAGRFADARGSLERVRLSAPENESLRARLAQVYEQTGAFKELADMSLADANATKDVAGRFAHLVRAGALLVQHGVDPEVAVTALEEAHALRPADAECTVLLADAYTVAGRTAEAVELINQAIASHKGRRSRDLGALYHRLARVAHHAGDRANEMGWLASALDMDGQNGFVASELADAAMALGQFDVAQRALRAITMLKGAAASPISKAVAYQHLGEIARQQGDIKRAVMLLKRAIDDDPSLTSARVLLDSLQAE